VRSRMSARASARTVLVSAPAGSERSDGRSSDRRALDVPVTAWLERFVRRSAPIAVSGVVLSLGLPHLLKVSGWSAFTLGTILGSIALLLSLTEPRETRGTFLSLFAWGYLLRLSVLLVLDHVVPAPVSILGPDSRSYLRNSQILADSAFLAPFWSWDAGPYYLFAGVLHVLNGDLFTLRLLNSGLTALVGPLAFSWFRLVLPRFAVLAGVVLAVHPTVIALSTTDLLKDPAVLFFTVLAVWALSRILVGTRASELIGFGLLAAGSLVFLRMARFYVVFYLEVAVTAVILAGWLGRPWRRRAGLAPLVGVLAVFLVAELGPMWLGWPSSAFLMASSVGWYAPGLVERLPERVVPLLRRPPAWYARGLVERLPERVVPSLGGANSSASLPARVAFEAVVQSANLFRRLYGPFVWVPPERWDVPTILGGDYLLYPGTLIWYGLLPFVGLGLLTTSVRLYRGHERDPIVAALWLFCVVYFMQYLTINLSYRQRDVMLPFLLLFAFIGLQRAGSNPRWPWAYATYWACLVVLAVSHLLVRASV
jgi:hypothetical protein